MKTNNYLQSLKKNLELLNHLTCMLLDCGRKLGNLERTQADTPRTYKSTQKGLMPEIEPMTVSL